jgi:protease I
MALSDKKVLMVVPTQGFDFGEYEVTRRVLESRGLRVHVAAPELGEVASESGRTVRSTARLGDVKYYDYDAIIFVGGPGARTLAETEAATKLAKDAEYKVLGAIGLGSLILARAGVVKGKRATGDPAVADAVRQKEGQYTAQPIEVSDKLVTGRGGQYAETFGQAVLRVMEK